MRPTAQLTNDFAFLPIELASPFTGYPSLESNFVADSTSLASSFSNETVLDFCIHTYILNAF